jgi:hypothetical protein
MIQNFNTTWKHGYNIMIGYPTLDHKYRLFKAKQLIWTLHVRYKRRKNWKVISY